jgi:UDP-N-acetyl-D-mannosaminuronic acid dehydrogenase
MILEKVLQHKLLNVLAVEPNVKAEEFKDDVIVLHKLDDALIKADIVLVLVDHDAFKSINLSLLKGKTLIDTRGLFDVV